MYQKYQYIHPEKVHKNMEHTYVGKKYVNDYKAVDPHDTVNMDFIVLASSLPEHRIEKDDDNSKKDGKGSLVLVIDSGRWITDYYYDI